MAEPAAAAVLAWLSGPRELPGVHLSSLLTELLVSIEEVRALVAERQRYDDWLAALEAKRADTPPRVFDRVYADYIGRRSEVISGLQSHIGELSAFGSDLEQRLGNLEMQLAAHEEELAEGMLRNLVGEYDDDRWVSVRQEVEGKIASLGGERDALQAEVEDVRSLLASARVAPPASDTVTAAAEEAVALAVASPTPVAAVVLEEAAVVVPAADADDLSVVFTDDTLESASAVSTPLSSASIPTPVVPITASPTPAAPVPSLEAFPDVAPVVFTPMAAADVVSADDDSLLDIDVSGIVENPVPQGASHEDVLADVAALFDTSSIAAVPEPEPTTPKGPVTQSEVDDALAMFGEVTGPADQQFVQSLQGIEAEHDARVDLSTATVTPPAAPSANDPFDDLAFLRSVIDQGGASEAPPAPVPMSSVASQAASSSEPQKTLRCTECGTMNLPTEWYCERCGGELAAF